MPHSYKKLIRVFKFGETYERFEFRVSYMNLILISGDIMINMFFKVFSRKNQGFLAM